MYMKNQHKSTMIRCNVVILTFLSLAIKKSEESHSILVEYTSNDDLMIESLGEHMMFSREHLAEVIDLHKYLINYGFGVLLYTCQPNPQRWLTHLNPNVKIVLLLIYTREADQSVSVVKDFHGDLSKKVLIKNNEFKVVLYDFSKFIENIVSNKTVIETRGSISRVISFALTEPPIELLPNKDYLTINQKSNLKILVEERHPSRRWKKGVVCSSECRWEEYQGPMLFEYSRYPSHYNSCRKAEMYTSKGFMSIRMQDEFSKDQFETRRFYMNEIEIYRFFGTIVYSNDRTVGDCKRVKFQTCEFYNVEIVVDFDPDYMRCNYSLKIVNKDAGLQPCILRMIIYVDDKEVVINMTMLYYAWIKLEYSQIKAIPTSYARAIIIFGVMVAFFAVLIAIVIFKLNKTKVKTRPLNKQWPSIKE